MTPVSEHTGEPADPRPNIVLIMADDMGFSDIGCYGGEIRTPALDRLGQGGIRFTQMYNAARCCPSRASLLTGLYPHQTGVGHLTYDLGLPPYRGSLNDRCVTVAEVLRAAGYSTLMSGKWHVTGDYPSGRPGRTPLDWGFDRWFGTLGGACSYYEPTDLHLDGEPIEVQDPGFYYTDAISDHAVRMIRENGSQPFFLYVAYTAPHWPLHAPEEAIERYRGTYATGWDAIRTARHERMRWIGIVDPASEISPRDELSPPWTEVSEKDWEDARMATYAAQVERMDQGIGSIVDELEERGIVDNTLILFLSDNGGCAELLREDGYLAPPPSFTRTGTPMRPGNSPEVTPGPADTFMSYGLPWANVSDAPFRLYKHWVHEGGIATPFVAHWPARIAPNGLCHQPLFLADITATCIDVAAASYPREHAGHQIVPLEGESFSTLLDGRIWQRERPICWEHEGNRAARRDELKLVSSYPGRWELYDLSRDRSEMRDLSTRYPDAVRQLAATYDQWSTRCGIAPWEEVAWRENRRVRILEQEHGTRVYAMSRKTW